MNSKDMITQYTKDATSHAFISEDIGSVHHGSLGNEFRVARSNEKAWSGDLQIRADYMIDFNKAVKEGKLTELSIERGIVNDIKTKAPEIDAILCDEYGDNWHYVENNTEVMRHAWEIAEALAKREFHGYEVNRVIRDYWENPRFQEDTHERVYLPEKGNERKALLVQAQYYNKARIEVRERALAMVGTMVGGDGDGFNAPKMLAMHEKLIEAWQIEEQERTAGCVYKIDEENQSLKLGDVDRRIAMSDVPEKGVIVAKLREVAGVEDMEELLSNIGFMPLDGGEYLLDNSKKGGARQMLYGRMAQRELMGICENGWGGVEAGSEKNADVMLMNAIGMESMAKMEAAGKALAVGEIYEQRAKELMAVSDDLMESTMDQLPRGIDKVNSWKNLVRETLTFTQNLNEVLYTASAVVSNLLRRQSDPGSWLRGVGEKMIDWVDRMSVRVAPQIDKKLGKYTGQTENDFDDQPGTYQRGRVNIRMPEIKGEEGANE